MALFYGLFFSFKAGSKARVSFVRLGQRAINASATCFPYLTSIEKLIKNFYCIVFIFSKSLNNVRQLITIKYFSLEKLKKCLI